MRWFFVALFLSVQVIGLASASSASQSAGVADAGSPVAGQSTARHERSSAGPFPLVTLGEDLERAPAGQGSNQLDRWFLWEPTNWKINSDLTNEVQNEEQVVVNPLNRDNLVAVWRDFRLGHRRVGVGYSFDGGVTWTDSLLEEPTYPRHSDPGLTTDRFGGIYAVILSYTGNTSQPNGLYVLKSEDGGVAWGDPVAVVNGVPDVFEDKELIACDRTGGVHDGNLYVAWDRFGWDTQIMSARSTDGGASFDDPVAVSDDDGVQWPTPVVGPDGTYYVAWAQYWPSGIRLDRSFDGGASFGSDITITSTYTASTEIHGGVTVFSFPAMDCDISGGTHDGRLYVAYMDAGGGDYDIFMRHSDDQGVSWSPAVRVNDDAYGNGSDQFHPWTVVTDDGVISVIFYDRRNDPSNLLMDLYMAQSFDGGVTFTPNLRVTTVSSDPTAGSLRAGLIGEYIGLAGASYERMHPVWTDTREGNQDAYTAIVDTTQVSAPNGAMDSQLHVAPPTPNPTTGETGVAYFAPGGGPVTIRVYNVAGRCINDMSESTPADGRGEVRWDGTDRAGEPVPSGVYFIRVSNGSAAGVAKVVILG